MHAMVHGCKAKGAHLGVSGTILGLARPGRGRQLMAGDAIIER